ncbi:MAG TPA: hypothetical protein H9700_10495 [Candidatus Eisenbergiella intestinipullorum]|nr:hypothetical protein [Candidatus Eisenbergiella intestinipullorum]
MIALQIKDVKHFMGRLLGTDLLDSFLLEEAVVSTYNTFTIDGRINRDFFSREEWEDPSVRPYDFSSWKSMRPILFGLIRGKKTPVSFRFVLHLMPQYVSGILKPSETSVTADQVKALVLTCRYENGSLTLVTGTSFHTFLPDKSADVLWDRMMKVFLDKKEVDYEPL